MWDILNCLSVGWQSLDTTLKAGVVNSLATIIVGFMGFAGVIFTIVSQGRQTRLAAAENRQVQLAALNVHRRCVHQCLGAVPAHRAGRGLSWGQAQLVGHDPRRVAKLRAELQTRDHASTERRERHAQTTQQTEEQLADNLAATEVKLTADELAILDNVSALPSEYPGWMLQRQSAERLPFA